MRANCSRLWYPITIQPCVPRSKLIVTSSPSASTDPEVLSQALDELAPSESKKEFRIEGWKSKDRRLTVNYAKDGRIAMVAVDAPEYY